MVFVKQIAAISDSNILFKQLSFNEINTLQFQNYDGFNLYLDISSLKYQEQDILTFYFDLRNYEGLISIHSKVVQSKDHIKQYFPIESKDSMFYVEENINQEYITLNRIYHLYFNKTIDATDDVYLLIELLIDQNMLKSLHQFNDKQITISKVALKGGDITIPIKSNKYYYRELFFLDSVYFQFNLTHSDPEAHLIIYCSANIMMVKYNSLNDPYEPSYFGQVAHASQYDPSSENQNSMLIISFFSLSENEDFFFHLYYDNYPLFLLPLCFLNEIYPIEINKENQTVFLLQQFWNQSETCEYSDIFFYVEHIYGSGVVQYNTKFTMDYILNQNQTHEEVFSTSSLSTSSLIIDATRSQKSHFFKVQCSSPCRFNIIFINRYSEDSTPLTPRKLFYFQDSRNEKFKIKSINDFAIDVESIERNEGNNKIKIFFDEYIYSLSKNKSNKNDNYRLKIFFAGDSKRMKNVNFGFSEFSFNDNWMKVIIHSDYNYTLVPLGKSEYNNGIMIFKFQDDPAINSYVIELALDNNEQYNEVLYYNYYGYGEKTYMPFPLYSRPLSIYRHRKLTFSNPYNKPNQKSRLIDHNKSALLYYFAMENVNNNGSISNTLSINYYNVYRDIYPNISPNTPIIIKPDQQHNANSFDSIKRTLYSNDMPNSMLVMQFYQCMYNGDLHYRLSYENQQLEDSYISRRTQLLRNNYGVEYNIEINGKNIHDTNFGLMFSYSYANTSLVNSVFTNELNTNYTIGYLIHGSSMSIYWNKYLKDQEGDLVYKVYLNKLNSQDDQCSILMDHEPYIVLYYSDANNNNDNLVTYSFKELTKGVYRVNVMAQVNKTLYLTQVYDEVIIEITANTSSIKTIIVLILVMLGVYSCYLLYVINSRCQINTHASIMSRSKS